MSTRWCGRRVGRRAYAPCSTPWTRASRRSSWKRSVYATIADISCTRWSGSGRVDRGCALSAPRDYGARWVVARAHARGAGVLASTPAGRGAAPHASASLSAAARAAGRVTRDSAMVTRACCAGCGRRPSTGCQRGYSATNRKRGATIARTCRRPGSSGGIRAGYYSRSITYVRCLPVVVFAASKIIVRCAWCATGV